MRIVETVFMFVEVENRCAYVPAGMTIWSSPLPDRVVPTAFRTPMTVND